MLFYFLSRWFLGVPITKHGSIMWYRVVHAFQQNNQQNVRLLYLKSCNCYYFMITWILWFFKTKQRNYFRVVQRKGVCTYYKYHSEIRNELFLSISDLSQSIKTSLLTSGRETLSYADNCFIFYSVFRFI